MNNLIPLLLFCLSTLLTPGPNNFMLMNSGLNFGIKKSVPHYLGICLGFPLMVLIFGASLRKLLKNEKHQKWFNIAMAVCLVASIAMIIFD